MGNISVRKRAQMSAIVGSLWRFATKMGSRFSKESSWLELRFTTSASKSVLSFALETKLIEFFAFTRSCDIELFSILCDGTTHHGHFKLVLYEL